MKRNRVILILVFVTLTTLAICIPVYSQDSDSEFNKQFQERFDAWVKARNEWIKAYPQYSYLGGAKDEEDNLIALGSKAIPFLIAMYESQLENRTWDNRYQADVFGLVSTLTRKRFSRSELPTAKFADRAFVQKLYVQWWNVGRMQTPEKYAEQFAKWDTLDKLGKKKEADKCAVAIADMGVEILPMVMQKIQDGDERLVPWVKRIMATRVEWKTADLATVLEWWEKNKENLAFPPVVVEKSADETTK